MRWGGEEFLVYSPKTNAQDLKGLTQRLLQAVGTQAQEIDGKSIPVTLTAGFIALPYSQLPEAVCNWERALQIADLALYLGKANGRNRAYGVGPLRVAPDEALAILDHDLSAALKAGMVELIEVLGPAQPAMVNAAASSVVGDWQGRFRRSQT
jgi:predicted signal transduction protein with EAL and GGDEF domain